ncbi:hypothetical protein GQ53DRAFT_337950 [Thozetella sp. PMI_491]|nr:hypothetical protein GQ53DRAFT_337950 [Thozetella sp. PMI_491]
MPWHAIGDPQPVGPLKEGGVPAGMGMELQSARGEMDKAGVGAGPSRQPTLALRGVDRFWSLPGRCQAERVVIDRPRATRSKELALRRSYTKVSCKGRPTGPLPRGVLLHRTFHVRTLLPTLSSLAGLGRKPSHTPSPAPFLHFILLGKRASLHPSISLHGSLAPPPLERKYSVLCCPHPPPYLDLDLDFDSPRSLLLEALAVAWPVSSKAACICVLHGSRRAGRSNSNLPSLHLLPLPPFTALEQERGRDSRSKTCMLKTHHPSNFVPLWPRCVAESVSCFRAGGPLSAELSRGSAQPGWGL